MVTVFDFVHIRGSAGLARIIRRQARHLHRTVIHIRHDWKDIEENTKQGEEEKVWEEFNRLFKDYLESEEEMDRIFENEAKIIHSSEGREKKIFTDFKSLFQASHGRSMTSEEEKVLKKIAVRLTDIQNKIYNSVNHLRKMQKDVFYDRHTVLTEAKQFLNMHTDATLPLVIKRKARAEKRDIKHEKHSEHNVEELIGNLEHIVRKGEAKEAEEKKFDNILHHLEHEVEKLESFFNDELKHITKIMTMLTVIHINFLDDIEKKIPGVLQEIKKEGFDSEKLEKLNQQEYELLQYLHKREEKDYRMIRYDTWKADHKVKV